MEVVIWIMLCEKYKYIDKIYGHIKGKLAHKERISPWMLWQTFVLVAKQHCVTSSVSPVPNCLCKQRFGKSYLKEHSVC